MNKISPIPDDEIDLSGLLKNIWDGKIKIILITFVTVAIVAGYNHINKKPVILI